MTPVDIFLLVIIALAVGGAAYYVYKEKKDGRKCIGCPYSSSCGKGGSCGGTCSLHNEDGQSDEEK